MVKEYVVYVEDHLIYAKAYGTWNESIYKSFDQAMVEAIKEAKKPFVEILDLRKWKIGTLDMINMAIDRHKYAIEAGRKAHLTIAKKGAMNYLITQNHIYKRTELYSTLHYIHFEDVETCCGYIEKQGMETEALNRFISELENMPYEETDLFMQT